MEPSRRVREARLSSALAAPLRAASHAKATWPASRGATLTGIHVAHAVIDGAIDTEFIAQNFAERYALKAHSGIVDPEAIAEAYWQLHRQPRSAWTHELDLRPWMEKW